MFSHRCWINLSHDLDMIIDMKRITAGKRIDAGNDWAYNKRTRQEQCADKHCTNMCLLLHL